jgi:hypothetical protein
MHVMMQIGNLDDEYNFLQYRIHLANTNSCNGEAKKNSSKMI